MPLETYVTLEANKRHLKGVTVSETQANGIVPADLLDAEAKAFTRINDWILSFTGAKAGKAIVDIFKAGPITVVDKSIIDLADLLASAYVWEWWEVRNFRDAQRGEEPYTPRYKELQEQALKLARGIERSGKTMKPDGTVRRWKYGPHEQGPIVGGAMVRGSYFDDAGTYSDPSLGTFRLPHRHPLLDAT